MRVYTRWADTPQAEPPETATEAGGTHPTGIHSCYIWEYFFPGPGLRQWIMNTAITGNEGGGFSFQNVGELNPTVLIEGCRIQNCGLKMLNMTSPGIIDMYIQVRIGSIGSSFETYYNTYPPLKNFCPLFEGFNGEISIK